VLKVLSETKCRNDNYRCRYKRQAGAHVQTRITVTFKSDISDFVGGRYHRPRVRRYQCTAVMPSFLGL